MFHRMNFKKLDTKITSTNVYNFIMKSESKTNLGKITLKF